MHRIQSVKKSFLWGEEGALTIFSIFMLMLILMITGASVDIMRVEAVRAKMQSTMDRAVLAAADLDQLQDPEAVVRDYVTKAGISDTLSLVAVEETAVSRRVASEGSATMDTIFLNMSGFDTLAARSAATAEERIANVEISLVLDISGSMRWNNRMDLMKPAAENFVRKVMTNESNGVTTLNLIPFAGQVNPGEAMFEYFRGERPKLKQNNGWGNGDQDAPGNSLCNNNAENADEGAADPSCQEVDGVMTPTNGYFSPWPQAISNMVFYFDTDGDDVYDVAHKIEDFPESAPRDADDFFQGAVAYFIAQDSDLTDPAQFLGASIKGGTGKNKYFQVKGDHNGDLSDLGPTKNNGRLPGTVYGWADIDYDMWAAEYVSPNAGIAPGTELNINMPGSCIEVYAEEFLTANIPSSTDYVPHFHHWPIAADVMDWGWCPGEESAIRYYSANADALVQYINDMRMHDGTGTHYGMKYALSLLNPDTAPAVEALIDAGLVEARFRGRPIAWNDPETEKFIVVMSDGATTEQVRPNDPDAPENGEVELQVQGGDSYYVLSTQPTNSANLQTQCDLARSLGVTIFAVALEADQAGVDELRACASSESHFFQVTSAEVWETFDIIARQINNLRLIQ